MTTYTYMQWAPKLHKKYGMISLEWYMIKAKAYIFIIQVLALFLGHYLVFGDKCMILTVLVLFSTKDLILFEASVKVMDLI